MAMTFSLFEYAKENCDELMADQPETLPQVCEALCVIHVINALIN